MPQTGPGGTTPADKADNPGFTGQIRDAATGLTCAQARYYDPAIGRFLSIDPVGFAEGGPGYFNRYSYTFNDPVNHVDPNGEFVLNAIGAGLNAALEVRIILAEGDVGLGEATARVGIAAATGAVGVGIGGRVAALAVSKGLPAAARLGRAGAVANNATGGALGGATAGAIAASGTETNQALTGNGFDGGEVIEGAALGALGGAATGAVAGGILVREAGEELANSGAARVKDVVSARLESAVGGATSIADTAVDSAQDVPRRE
ncbi:RHS repeat-associated core domain-containing protein [Maricaulaceae bacterium EIL42A08]|nr:RHS repeat-associated core domain-containing protein [Maricaulaceae bacterium EIL42A08]